ncbi:exonuclease domain-containing protein [Streptomyces sp. NPDC051555]|uniref:exonuclease domain-containing protein n=1 Tax=Streptomyces sp. NPDC051555 TaxID=3365657 RepID=UPI003791B4CA
MSSTTTVTERVPSSRTETDLGQVAREAPRDHIGGVPVYGWGKAPGHLRTQTQLGEVRLKLAEGQLPLAYLRLRKHGDVPLYDPAGAEKMTPLASAVKARMEKRRTCPECGTVRPYIVRGKRCSSCENKAYAEQRRLAARTCRGCREVAARRLPAHGRCQWCRRAQLAAQREKAAAWVAEVTVCAGEGCAVKLVTKKVALAFQKSQGVDCSWWHRAADWPRRCAPCTAAEERRQAEQRAKWELDARERREGERRAAQERTDWAAAALLDPTVVVLDTETTGLHGEARIVEIAVLSSGGEVLLDTLLDPGEPIPGDSSDIHGITDADVAGAGAPTFSEVLVRLADVLTGKRVLIYNDVYDVERLRYELTLHYAREQSLVEARELAAAWLDGMAFEDVMIPYSDWVGDWSDYHGGNRWQPLGGGHRAAGDCRAVLGCLAAMGRPTGAGAGAYEMADADAGSGDGTDG